MTGNITPYTDNITSEHWDKPNFMAMVGATVQPFADLKTVLDLIPLLYNLDTAVGQQLDVVGEWVGVSRNLSAPLTGVYFAFDTSGVGFDAGVWQGPYDPSTGIIQLPDEFYRLVIRARILNNSWDGSKDAIYTLTSVIFGSAGFTYYVEDHGDLTIGIGLLGPTTPPPILVALLNSGALDVKGVTIQISSRVAQQGPVFSFDLNSLLFQGFDTGVWTV